MKNFKTISIRICILLIGSTFMQCASSQNMKNTSSIQIKELYFQKWTSQDNNGFTIYIPTEDTSRVSLKYAYFKQKRITLTKEEGKSLYTGSYVYPKKATDLIMSSDPKEEFQNTVPVGIERIPFRLKDNECVIVYTKDGKEGHFKIENVPEKKE